MIFGLSPALFWFLIALVLGAIELLSLSFFLLWPALAALIVSVVMLLIPGLNLGWQLVIFALISVVLLVPGRRWAKVTMIGKDSSSVNERGEQMINRLGYVVSGRDGIYRAKIGDTEWSARGEHSLKKGDQIRVVGVDGITLTIEAS